MVSGRTRRVEFSRVRISSPTKRGPYDDGPEDEPRLTEASGDSEVFTPGYIYLNWVAILGHLASVIGMLIIYGPREPFGVPYSQTYLAWDRTIDVFNATTNETESICPGVGVVRNTANDGQFCLFSKTELYDCGTNETTGKQINCALDYGWLIISFHMLSFFFQLLAAMTDEYRSFKCGNWHWRGFSIFGYRYSEMIESGKNPLRFIEYSISASIMLMIIAIINGIFDIHVLFAIAILTCSCQLCGLVVEYLDPETQLRLMWINHMNGWLTFCTAYYIIATAFFASLNYDPDIQPPDFVYAIVVAIFLLYASFGLVQLVELSCLTCPCGNHFTTVGRSKAWCPACRTRPKVTPVTGEPVPPPPPLRCNPLYKEMVFVTLSLGAKLTLGWLLFVNVFMT